MVKNTDFNEEVTKHSVHTLVFRSLKRTHDMFVSDQGNLPDIDKEAEALLWKVKSKSVYGQVQQKVDQVGTNILLCCKKRITGLLFNRKSQLS